MAGLHEGGFRNSRLAAFAFARKSAIAREILLEFDTLLFATSLWRTREL